ncbi:hypothetical protein FB565_005087 [Actinoplanes lutulentus]|uniref:hypothetical protein n=1 Tax=Actinoplanes lutulentus TaxID=1287878 RepID=UPI000DB92E19|nr:hypothetical protein [Actinoplanes lutulentus]MBB2945354.1 hypothetical protein [Actinoplanes lutulentus]
MGTAFLGGLIGLALLGFGARILVSGHAPAVIARSFRADREAGWYHLLFGVALVIFVVGARLPGEASGTTATILSIALVAVAVVRFRPRGRVRDEEP